MTNFWNQLQPGFLALAPMEEVTDCAFRQLLFECGCPDVFFTEFASCEGISHAQGIHKVIHRLKYTPDQRPIVAQIWGKTPQNYLKTAKIIVDMGFDGIDINMGCPVKKVIKQGCCSALIKNQSLAKEIVLATKEGAQAKIPVSIKTRIGLDVIDTENWLSFLLSECEPQALTIHGRTVKEMSKVPNHWEEIAKAVQIKKNLNSNCLLVGNGDITSYKQAKQKSETLGLDGVMIGRGVFKNPWIFNPKVDIAKIEPKQRIQLLIRHLQLFEYFWKGQKDYNSLKRFFKIYIQAFKDASDLRTKLMETKSTQEAIKQLKSYLSLNPSS